MTYWQDDTPAEAEFVVPEDVVDVAYRMQCRELPVDHIHGLCSALHAVLPWLRTESSAGVHPIYGAASGNGWQRPQQPDAALHLSRRTRLKLRVPAHRLGESRALVGRRLRIAGRDLGVGELTVKLMSTSATLYARYVASDRAHDEECFLAEAAMQLGGMDVPAVRMLAGRLYSLKSPSGPISVRSLMVAGLSPAESIRLQQRGLGWGRAFCCGVFVPHRGIEPVGQPT